ncbi:RNA polymerase II C-terminal domain phosphatase-like 4 [Citrus sinensis]|uniref:RNA polymerase II C-terminal domain phosphatase-like 4 n=1 Tax=Citrus sinensis TaxID=2711 RepID=A0ACB8L1Z6_CITSI|nr:RNA polymerase II C-terminal domain phosphatase-like 4 [Citrus sinensis]
MSLATDSPVNSSSSDDLAAFLDAELDSNSLGSSPEKEAEDKDEDEESIDEEAENEEARDDKDLERIKRRKTQIVETIQERPGPTSLGNLEEKTDMLYCAEVSLGTDNCPHPGSLGGMCYRCGKRLEEESGVTFSYICKGLRLGNDEIDRLRNTDMKHLLRHRKLYLILDLDHTLLNSTLLLHLTPEEDYLKSQADSLQDVSKGSLFMLAFMNMMTKLRPFVHTFLKEASEMFEMYIYTMGDRPYALEMAKLLDPSREYFNARVISRDDGTQRHQKGLDVVLGQESAVLILDDTENAWTKHRDNLILMERYHFFASSCRQFGYHCQSLSQLRSDESELEGALASVLKVLKRIHNIFFDVHLSSSAVVDEIRYCLFRCLTLFTGNHFVGTCERSCWQRCEADTHYLWKMAEQLGATCSIELDPSVTHVVSTDARTEKSRWAAKEAKFLVDPRWIETANFLWQRQPEENFPVQQTKPEENFHAKQMKDQ